MPSPQGAGGPLAVDEVEEYSIVDTTDIRKHLISHFVTASPQGEALASSVVRERNSFLVFVIYNIIQYILTY